MPTLSLRLSPRSVTHPVCLPAVKSASGDDRVITRPGQTVPCRPYTPARRTSTSLRLPGSL